MTIVDRGRRCVKCGHYPSYHGMTFCSYDYGAAKTAAGVKCDCDGWMLVAPDTDKQEATDG